MGTAKDKLLRSRTGVIALLVVGALVALTVVAVGRVSGHEKSVAVKASHEAEPTIGEAGEGAAIKNREHWFFHQRAYPAAHTPVGARLRAAAEARSLDRAQRAGRVNAAPSTGIHWAKIGPQPIGTIGPDAASASGLYLGSLPAAGRVSVVTPDPNNASVVYLGGAAGGVWKSTDGGNTWTPKFDSQASLAMGAIAVDHTNSNNVWAGTGEPHWSGDSYYGAGVYKSTNGGATWTKMGGATFLNRCVIFDIVVVNSSTVVLAAGDYGSNIGPSAVCGTAQRGIWRTTNGGVTWSHIFVPSSSFQLIMDFAQLKAAPNTIYAGGYLEGAWKSTNGGATWSKLTGLVLPTSTSVPYCYRPVVGIAPSSPSTVYYACANQFSFGLLLGVWKTTNGGTTWTKVVSPTSTDTNTPCTYPGSFSSGQCVYDFTLSVHPTNPTTFFLGGIRMFRFTSSGAVRTPVGYGFGAGKIHVDQQSSGYDKSGRLWIGNDGGIYRTDDNGSSFVNRNGPVSTSGTGALAIAEFNGWTSGSVASGRFLGGLQDDGTVRFDTATGANWRMDHGGDGGASAFISSTTYFTSYYGPSVYRTMNAGSTYSKISTSTIDGEPSEFYPPLERGGPAASTALYRGTKKVWRTTNSTASVPLWTAISPIFSGAVTAIGVGSGSPNNDVYAGVDATTSTPNKLMYTHNATAGSPTWSTAPGLPNRFVTDIHVRPGVGNTAIATFSGFGTGHVYRTTNGGASWTNISGNLPDTPVNAVAVDYTRSPARIFVGTDTGVFWTVDNGVTWGRGIGTSGMPLNAIVLDLRIDGSLLVAATHGRSAYKAPMPS